MHVFIVNTCGMFGSASTWLFNITAEVLKWGYPDKSVLQVYTDNANEDVFKKHETLDIVVLKSHFRDPIITHLNDHSVVPSILTLVDPRKSVQSSMTRFGFSFDRAKSEVVRNIENVSNLMKNKRILILRYDEKFYLHLETVKSVAAFLGVQIDNATANEIFEKYTKTRVKEYIKEFDTFQKERIKTLHFTDVFSDKIDQVTQFHAKHFSDTTQTPLEVFFNPGQLCELTNLFREFMRDSGYA